MTAVRAAVLGGALISASLLLGGAPAQAAGGPAVNQPGRFNAITDVPGVDVGQVQSDRAPYLTGVTVVHPEKRAVTGVDQRGGAPATKETDLLRPENSNPGVNAVMLGGSSMYGLGATDGVIRWLEEREEGVDTGAGVAPIVPAADIFDLARGGDFAARTGPGWGYLAADAASGGPVRQGAYGGGTGALSGGLKSGVGAASVRLGGGVVVGALVVVNSAGSPVDPADCSLYAARAGLGDEFKGLRTPTAAECAAAKKAQTREKAKKREKVKEKGEEASEAPRLNTTIAVVATNAPLDKAAATRMAENAHDGMARAVNPIHTLEDGDTVFGMSTGKGAPLSVSDPADAGRLDGVFNAASDTLTRAIGHAVLSARSAGHFTSYCATYPSACAHLGRPPVDGRGRAPQVTAAALKAAEEKVAGGTPEVPGGSGAPAPSATAHGHGGAHPSGARGAAAPRMGAAASSRDVPVLPTVLTLAGAGLAAAVLIALRGYARRRP